MCKILSILIIAVMVMTALSPECLAADLDLIFVVAGETYDENLGNVVFSPGDLDGDGYSEVFVGAFNSEVVKVFFGGNPADTFPDKIYASHVGRFTWLSDINGDSFQDFARLRNESDTEFVDIIFGDSDFYSKSEADFTIWGDVMESFGIGIFAAISNGDDKTDIIISAPNTSSPLAGRFYIFQASSDLDSIADDTLSIIRGEKDEFITGACIGDINNDGFADYAISTYLNAIPAYILIFWGSEFPDSIPDLRIDSPFNDAPGEGAFGHNIVPTGDINKDNIDDFIVTSEGFPPCVFYGGDPFDPTPKILEYPGKTANVCGDINHDGWEDIAVGFTLYSYGSGMVLVYFGSHDMDTIADIVMPYDSHFPLSYNFGRSLGPAGDFNGDGVDDLAVGAKSDNTQNSKGFLFVFAGDSGLPTPAEDEPEVPIPDRYDILKQNYPNPFNNGTFIGYHLSGLDSREIEISIYNILGRKVRSLYKGHQKGGDHSIYWDGLDDKGHPLSSGLYFYALATLNKKLAKKMIFLK